MSRPWMVRDDKLGEPHRSDRYCLERCHPAVAIDPDDREQVERLVRLFWSVQKPDDGGSSDFAYMTTALREFAKPIPPQCTAALIVKGQHFYCDTAAGHDLPHGNSAAEAIWGVQS